MSDGYANPSLTADMADGISQLGRERLWTHARVLMLTAEFDGTIRAVNPAWLDILGWKADDLVGKNLLDFVHPDDMDRTQAEAGLLATANHQTPKFENRYRRADGGFIDIDWTAISDHQFIHALGRDVTIEKGNVQALLIAEDAARQSQKMEAIGQLTGGVAHDFNNLLTVITGSIELLDRPNLTEARRKQFIQAIRDTAGRAAALTRQLLAFARRQSLTPEAVSIEDSLSNLTSLLTTLTGSRIVIETRFSAEPCWVLVDKSQFDTAIVNMAINARDAMDGEGRIVLAATRVLSVPAIRSHPETAGDFVAITITDTGHGIAPELIARIFEPFYTTKATGQGTGLGLSQVIGFAKQSGGEILADSVLGKGSTFTLYLPRFDPETLGTTPPVKTEPDEAQADGICVLVVEDNLEVGEFARVALHELGYKVALATNAKHALQELADDPGSHHAVFSDVVMPGMSGLELAQEINRLYPDLPVILASGYSHVLAQNNAHGFELLHKPYSIDQLSQVISKTLALKQA